MKRYSVFAGTNHYPMGGCRDLIGQLDNIKLAVRIADQDHPNPQLSDCKNLLMYHWAHIFDTDTNKVVCYRFDDGKWKEAKGDDWPTAEKLEKQVEKILRLSQVGGSNNGD